MTFFQVATFAFAAIGVASVLYVLVNWFTAKTLDRRRPDPRQGRVNHYRERLLRLGEGRR